METAIFRLLDPISVLFFTNFKTACDRSGMHLGPAMWLFRHFIQKPAKDPLAHHRSALVENDAHREGKLTGYCQITNYLLKFFAADDIIAEAEADIMK